MTPSNLLFIICTFLSYLILPLVRGDQKELSCGPNLKQDNVNPGICVRIEYNDFLSSLSDLHHPLSVARTKNECIRFSVKSKFGVCEDHLPKYVQQQRKFIPSKDTEHCVMWSIIASRMCNDLGSLGFERYWSKRGCKVKVFHFVTLVDHANCDTPPGLLAGNENVEIIRQGSMTHYRYNWWFNMGILKYINEIQKAIKKVGATNSAVNSNGTTMIETAIGRLDISGLVEFSQQAIHVLKIQGRDSVDSPSTASRDFMDYDGLVYYLLSEWYQYHPNIIRSKFQQLLFTSSLNKLTLQDTITRGDQFIWNVWATKQFLTGHVNSFLGKQYSEERDDLMKWRRQQYVNIRNVPEEGLKSVLPLQYHEILAAANLSTNVGSYHQTWLLVDIKTSVDKDAFIPKHESKKSSLNHVYSSLRGHIPPYCKEPSPTELNIMQDWIHEEIHVRCHPTQISVPCIRDRGYDAIIPCSQDLINALAEDYAISKGWCDFKHTGASIPPLKEISSLAEDSIKRRSANRVRLAFFFTVYTDYLLFERIFSHLYDSYHFYLIHIDPIGGTQEFNHHLEEFVAPLQKKNNNIFIIKEVPIVYGSATASILLSRAMAWFNIYSEYWDYLISLTGSDYPLVPLYIMEKILTAQKPPMPFVMSWSAGTGRHIFRLTKTYPVFANNHDIQASIAAVLEERGGKVYLGVVPMSRRSGNFGPPLSCKNIANFYRLDNRRNKSASSQQHDTQWLFPRDTSKNKGYAFAEEGIQVGARSFDGQYRVWKKSDPATTAAYDRETVRYLVENEEGKKFYHFFKYMLLGSEEHYFVSILYNWPRTKTFVQTLSSQFVWNTWSKGIQRPAVLKDGFQTHTNFLSMKEYSILKGFAMRGMMFARKFHSAKTKNLLDIIDKEFLSVNGSLFNEVGKYWPGYYEVDVESSGNDWKKNLISKKKNP